MVLSPLVVSESDGWVSMDIGDSAIEGFEPSGRLRGERSSSSLRGVPFRVDWCGMVRNGRESTGVSGVGDDGPYQRA